MIINFRFFWILVIFTFGYVLDTTYLLNSHQNTFFTFGYVLDTFCILTFKTWTGVIRIQELPDPPGRKALAKARVAGRKALGASPRRVPGGAPGPSREEGPG